MPEEYVVLVDKHDKEIGIAEKIEAHKQAYLHRAFSVFLFSYNNNKTQLLLQKRQINKYHCGNLWTNTCCSHPRVNESILNAGVRRLEEELGIKNIKLQSAGAFIYKAIFANGLTEHEYDHVLIGEYANNDINYNSQEVQDIKQIEVDLLKEDLQNNPEQYTPWLSKALVIAEKTWYELFKKNL